MRRPVSSAYSICDIAHNLLLHPCVDSKQSLFIHKEIEDRSIRTQRIKCFIQQLPFANFSLLKILVEHLRKVARHSHTNRMTVSNLGICFGPTLMRGTDESMSEIKYSNIVTNTLIEEFDSIFNDPRVIHNNISQNHSPHIQSPITPNYTFDSPLNYHPNSQFTHFVPMQSNDKILYRQPPIELQQLVSDFQPSQTYCEQQQQQQLPPPPPPPHQQPQTQLQLQQQPIPWQLPFIPINPTNNFAYRSDRVISLYACVADLDSELSFGPNEIIIDGK